MLSRCQQRKYMHTDESAKVWHRGSLERVDQCEGIIIQTGILG